MTTAAESNDSGSSDDSSGTLRKGIIVFFLFQTLITLTMHSWFGVTRSVLRPTYNQENAAEMLDQGDGSDTLLLPDGGEYVSAAHYSYKDIVFLIVFAGAMGLLCLYIVERDIDKIPAKTLHEFIKYLSFKEDYNHFHFAV